MRKLITFAITIGLIGQSFLFSFPQAYAIERSAQNLAGCNAFTTSNDVNTNSNNITFGSIFFKENGALAKQTVTFRSDNTQKTYNFRFEKVEQETQSSPSPTPTPTTYYNYIYKNTDSALASSKLVVETGNAVTFDTFLSLKITNPSNVGDSYYKKYVDTFNQKSRLFKGQCDLGYMFGSDEVSANLFFKGDEAPVIKLPGWSGGNRPAINFKLTDVSDVGGLTASNNHVFVFTYLSNDDNADDTNFSNLAIKLFQSGSAEMAKCSNPDNYQECPEIDVKVNLDRSKVWLLFNHAYNSKAAGGDNVCGAVTTYESSDPSNARNDKKLANWSEGESPKENCLNKSATGWLKKWGVDVREQSGANPEGNEPTCGIVKAKWADAALCAVAELILGFFQGLGNWVGGLLNRELY